MILTNFIYTKLIKDNYILEKDILDLKGVFSKPILKISISDNPDKKDLKHPIFSKNGIEINHTYMIYIFIVKAEAYYEERKYELALNNTNEAIKCLAF